MLTAVAVYYSTTFAKLPGDFGRHSPDSSGFAARIAPLIALSNANSRLARAKRGRSHPFTRPQLCHAGRMLVRGIVNGRRQFQLELEITASFKWQPGPVSLAENGVDQGQR